jgi:hypothetical protein
MNAIPVTATALFLATVGLVAMLFVAGVRKAAGADPARRARWTRRAAAGAAAWLIVTGALAAGGALAGQRLPPPLLVLLAASLAVCLALAFSPLGGRMAAGVAPAWLVGYQAFRVPVEWFLYRGYEAGLVPPQMTFEGRNWDVLTGLSAPLVAWLVARGRVGPGLLLAWNLAGLALLANVLTVAVLSMPTPLRVFTEGPPNAFVADFPFVWLPAVLVQAALLGHLLLFRALLRRHAAPLAAQG